MVEFDGFETPLIEAPLDCMINCPTLGEATARLTSLRLASFAMTKLGEEFMEEMPEEQKLDYMRHLEESHADELAEEGLSAAEAVELTEKEARKLAGDTLAEVQDKLAEQEKLVEKLTESCPGKIKLRGAKNGIEYTVTICGSLNTPKSADQAFIDRKLKNQ